MTDEEKAAEEAKTQAETLAASEAAAALARRKAESEAAAKRERALTAADAADIERSVFERVTAGLAAKPAAAAEKKPGGWVSRVLVGLVIGLVGAGAVVAFFVFRRREAAP